jgi:hypothetical protein
LKQAWFCKHAFSSLWCQAPSLSLLLSDEGPQV